MSLTPLEPFNSDHMTTLIRLQSNQTHSFMLKADRLKMTPQMLDYYFPFVLFFYGFLVLLVIENPALARLGEQKMGAAWQRLAQRRVWAWGSFFIGGFWALQNVLLTPL